MVLFYFSTFLFISISYGIESHLYILEYTEPRKLQFSEGDFLACRMDSNFLSTIYGAEHAMLALSSADVAHISDVSLESKFGNNSGLLRIDNFISMTRTKGYTACRVGTEQYDRFMLDLGVQPKSPSSAVSDAKNDMGRRTYYNLFGCNCQHWVTHWKYGKAYSIQSNQPPNKECELENYFARPYHSSASAYSRDGQYGAHARAGLGEYLTGKGILNSRVLGPHVEAQAHFGKHYTGVGFKVKHAESGFRLGNNFGVTSGLNIIDNEVGAGLDGVRFKSFGTGVVYSRSQGSKICIIGTCFHYFGK